MRRDMISEETHCYVSCRGRKKREKVLLMKKRLMVTLCLAMAMVFVLAQAACAVSLNPKTTKMSNVKFHADGQSVQSIDVQYVWPSNLASADMYLVVLDKDIGNDDTLYFTYADEWATFSEAISGVQARTGAKSMAYSAGQIHSQAGAQVKTTFQMAKDVIPLSKDKEYFVYIFTEWAGSVYPDARIGVMGVKNGGVTFKAEGSSQTEQLTPETTTTTSAPTAAPTTAPTSAPTAAPAPAPTPVSNEVKQNAASMPKTGDESLPLVYLAVMMGGLAGLAVLRRKRA